MVKQVVQKVYVNTDEANQALVHCQQENKTKKLLRVQKELKKMWYKQSLPKRMCWFWDTVQGVKKIIWNVSEMLDGSDLILETAQKFAVAMQSTNELRETLR